MNKDVFAKIIDLPDHQVLVELIDFGEDEIGRPNEFLVKVKTVVSEVAFTHTVSFLTYGGRQSFFDSYDKTRAEHYIKHAPMGFEFTPIEKVNNAQL